MITMEALKEYGADVEGGLKRCMNNETFYLNLVPKAVADDACERLLDAVAGKRYQEAFEIAHGLKGAAGNLGLTPIFTPASALTEYFRNDVDESRDEEYIALAKEVLAQKEKLAALVS